MNVRSALVAACVLCLPAAAEAAPYQLSFSGVVSAYSTIPGDAGFPSLVPVGAAVSGTVTFDATAGVFTPAPASGTITVGNASLAAVSAGLTASTYVLGGQPFDEVFMLLSGPAVPPIGPAYAPGVLGLTFGMPSPNPFGTTVGSSNLAITVAYGQLDQQGALFSTAPLTQVSAVITAGTARPAPVPEPGTLALVGAGVLGMSSLRRRV